MRVKMRVRVRVEAGAKERLQVWVRVCGTVDGAGEGMEG